jgi:hypothetical protein
MRTFGVSCQTVLQRVKRGELGEPGVELHANVLRVEPYLECSAALAVPLRIGGGTRLKILEALAAGLPMVSSGVGAEGSCWHRVWILRSTIHRKTLRRRCCAVFAIVLGCGSRQRTDAQLSQRVTIGVRYRRGSNACGKLQ